MRSETGIKGRWHDARHTFVTDLAEDGAVSDGTIRQLAGHVSKKMLEHYSHIRMDAKRRAVAGLTVDVEPNPAAPVSIEAAKESAKVTRLN